MHKLVLKSQVAVLVIEERSYVSISPSVVKLQKCDWTGLAPRRIRRDPPLVP